jgi:hypothetical protein
VVAWAVVAVFLGLNGWRQRLGRSGAATCGRPFCWASSLLQSCSTPSIIFSLIRVGPVEQAKSIAVAEPGPLFAGLWRLAGAGGGWLGQPAANTRRGWRCLPAAGSCWPRCCYTCPSPPSGGWPRDFNCLWRRWRSWV